MPPCGNCQESCLIRLPQNTSFFEFSRIIPTFERYPLRSIMRFTRLIRMDRFFHILSQIERRRAINGSVCGVLFLPPGSVKINAPANLLAGFSGRIARFAVRKETNKERREKPMRVSNYFISTLKEAPAEAELISHKLMLRAGLIKRLGGGLYTWMPLGLRVLRNVENIVREEMDASGALELLMPAVQPAELWQETGRWEVFGPQMLKIKDRHQRDFCFGPTHEEVITDIARREIKSYRQLPLTFYQV